MLFSIIVPVYNVETYLRECIESVLTQEYSDYELILVDDGSKDNSGCICDEYAQKDERITVIHQENAGQAVARNTGTSVAKGGYIVYLDSDDYICDKKFLLKLAEKTKQGTDVIFYGYKKFFQKTQTFGEDICQYPVLQGEQPEKAIQLLLETDTYDGSPWNKTVKKSFLDDNKIAFVPKMISEDSDWFLQVVTKAKTYDNINEAFVVYRQREGSTSHAPKVKSLTDNIRILQTWSARFEEYGLDEKFKASLKSVLARYYANMLVLYARFPKEQVNEYFKQVKDLQYLLKYSVTKRARIVKTFCAVFGVRLAVVALKVLDKIRG